MTPHRGVLVLVLGILSMFTCSILTGIPAWILGRSDLAAMDAGEMDPSGRSITQVGMVLGIVSVVLFALSLVASCLWFGLFAGVIFGAASESASQAPGLLLP